MHVELARALAPVIHDLETTGGPVPQVLDEDWQHDPSWPSAMLRGADVARGGALDGADWPPCPKDGTAVAVVGTLG